MPGIITLYEKCQPGDRVSVAPEWHARTFVAYLRVSTGKQGRSGLGREAKRPSNGFLQPWGRLLCPTFEEVESGRRSDRPELAKALDRCRRTGATEPVSSAPEPGETDPGGEAVRVPYLPGSSSPTAPSD